jgi:hypothetical protein
MELVCSTDYIICHLKPTHLPYNLHPHTSDAAVYTLCALDLFYGQENGVVIEMGAAGGDPATYSVSYYYDINFNWKRVLVEANPVHFNNLHLQPTRDTPTAYAVGAAVCKNEGIFHYIFSADKHMQYISGIYELMNKNFLKKFHRNIHDRVKKEGSPGKWSVLPPDMIRINCLPLSTILRDAGVTHINWFNLDIEGGELEALRSIDWNVTTFDVLTVETEPWFRPPGFKEDVTALLAEHGYVVMIDQKRRNSWYRHKSFKPSAKPGAKRSPFMIV